jgi:hypothetical protein
MKSLFLTLLLIAALACKSDSKKKLNVEAQTEAKEQEKELTVIINFKTNKPDDFKLMLNNIVIDEFQKKNIHIIETVASSTSFEPFRANFGKRNISNYLVFNLGNKEQKEIKINTIEFTYGENTILINKSNFNKFLRVNQFIDYDKNNFSIKTKQVEGKHNPSIFARKTLIDFLKRETSN